MTVYVDDMRAAYGRMVMCHTIADTDDELHAMADAIGVERRWHQKPGTARSHYDIALSKRAIAVQLGAVEITWRQSGAMTAARGALGALGSPDEAIAWQRGFVAERRAAAIVATMRALAVRISASTAERGMSDAGCIVGRMGTRESKRKLKRYSASNGSQMTIKQESIMKKLVITAALLALASTAHAAGPHGGAGLGAIGGAYGMAAQAAASHAATSTAPGQSGQGGSYWTPREDASLVDGYQPYPEAEMRKFQKQEWTSYRGD
jgi:hypothetical protein